jgi:fermentation-respiration switch protein FrsA (DUF1100 family)
LVAHSPRDEIVPFAHGRRIYEAANEPKQFFELTGTHNDAGWETAPGYLETLRSFVERLGLDAERPPQ